MDIGNFEGWATSVTPHLFRYARHLEPDWHGAEDLVQDTLAKLYTNWWRIDETRNLKAYALQTMFHLFVSRRRRRSSGEIVTDSLPEALTWTIDPVTRLLLDRSEGWVRTTSFRALARLRSRPQLASSAP